MPLTFNGSPLSGIPLQFLPGMTECEFIRTKFTGVSGESEIQAGSGAREISIRAVIFGGFKTRTQLHAYIDNTFNRDEPSGGVLGVNDTLAYTSDAGAGGQQKWNFTYGDCTFRGFEIDPEFTGLLDVAGTLDGGWWCIGTLHFRQLSQDKDT